MATTVDELLIKIRADVSDVQTKLKKFENEAQKTTSKVQNTFNRLSTGIKVVIGSVLVAQLVRGANQMVKFASDIEEMSMMSEAVFGKFVFSVREELSEFADAVGRSSFTLEGMAASVQDTFVPLGFAREEASKLSVALTKLAVEKEKVSMSLQDKEARKKEEESQPQAQEQVTPPVSQRAQKWAEDNDWFGSDRVLTNAAMSIHEELVQQGIDGESDEYYNQINKRMKEYFPQKFAQSSTEEQPQKAAPVQNVASVSRRQGGRKSVKLTKSQVVIAKKLGVPLEEYAKYVKEGV